MALNILRPGVPGMQPVGDLHTAKSAILFGVINGLFSPPVLELCLCSTGGGRPCGDDDDDNVEPQRYLIDLLGSTTSSTNGESGTKEQTVMYCEVDLGV
jgi:hypothetical protein